jgi:hypothetical protein
MIWSKYQRVMGTVRDKELLEEILEQIRECLPDGIKLEDWIDDADRLEDCSVMKNRDDATCLAYQYGRLLGAAEWADRTVLELLDDHGISLEVR